MKRTIPQLVSLVAMVVGAVLFVVTMMGIDREETIREARILGLALPLVMLPSLGWHLLRAAGWYVCFLPTRGRRTGRSSGCVSPPTAWAISPCAASRASRCGWCC